MFLDISFLVFLLNMFNVYTTYTIYIQDNNLYTKILFQLLTRQTKWNKYKDTRRTTSKLMIMSFSYTEKQIQKNDVQLPMLFSLQSWISHLQFCIHVICYMECESLHSSSTNIILPFANTTNQQPKSKIYNPPYLYNIRVRVKCSRFKFDEEKTKWTNVRRSNIWQK